MIINQWSLKQEIAMMSLMLIKAFSWHFYHSIAMPGFPFIENKCCALQNALQWVFFLISESPNDS